MPATIRRNLALREYDLKTLPSGRQAVFSVKFVKKNGELCFIPRVVASEPPFSVCGNRMRGVMPLDESLNQLGNITAVDIDALVEWNGVRVVL